MVLLYIPFLFYFSYSNEDPLTLIENPSEQSLSFCQNSQVKTVSKKDSEKTNWGHFFDHVSPSKWYLESCLMYLWVRIWATSTRIIGSVPRFIPRKEEFLRERSYSTFKPSNLLEWVTWRPFKPIGTHSEESLSFVWKVQGEVGMSSKELENIYLTVQPLPEWVLGLRHICGLQAQG